MSLRCRVSPDRPCWFADFDPEAQVTESEIADMNGGGFRFLHFGESFMIRFRPHWSPLSRPVLTTGASRPAIELRSNSSPPTR